MWHKLHIGNDFNLKHTFDNGQCFGWRRHEEDHYSGVIHDTLFALKQEDIHKKPTVSFSIIKTLKKSLTKCSDSALVQECTKILADYFQLNINIDRLYSDWLKRDPDNERLQTVARCISGMRILRQPPWECLVSFICSSNNNIPRITQMLHSLRQERGRYICDYEGVSHYTFPTPSELSDVGEERYRSLGFGYRAKYIHATVQKVNALGGESFLFSLRGFESTEDVRNVLVDNFTGVGPKVADCIALFSLDRTDAIPVDTHVWRIACRDYDPTLRECKSLTPTVYRRVGDLFRTRYGEYAGWAHSLLFSAELSVFSSLLPENLINQMREFRAKEKELAKEAKMKRQKARLSKIGTDECQGSPASINAYEDTITISSATGRDQKVRSHDPKKRPRGVFDTTYSTGLKRGDQARVQEIIDLTNGSEVFISDVQPD